MADEELGELLSRCTNLAARKRRATDAGNSLAANRAYDELEECYRKIIALGDRGRTGLLSLLESSDEGVRKWAAVVSLPFAPDLAVPALEKVASGRHGLLSFEANVALSQFRAGRFKLYGEGKDR